MMDWLRQLDFWHWWLLAGLLLLLEMWAPTYFFLWLGIGAAAIGFLFLVVPELAVEHQLMIFGLCTALAIIGWYRHRDAGSA